MIELLKSSLSVKLQARSLPTPGLANLAESLSFEVAFKTV